MDAHRPHKARRKDRYLPSPPLFSYVDHFMEKTYNCISVGGSPSGLRQRSLKSSSWVRIPHPLPNFKEKVMKIKVPAPRRQFMVAARFKSGAGVHRKTNKALRKQQNQKPVDLSMGFH